MEQMRTLILEVLTRYRGEGFQEAEKAIDSFLRKVKTAGQQANRQAVQAAQAEAKLAAAKAKTAIADQKILQAKEATKLAEEKVRLAAERTSLVGLRSADITERAEERKKQAIKRTAQAASRAAEQAIREAERAAAATAQLRADVIGAAVGPTLGAAPEQMQALGSAMMQLVAQGNPLVALFTALEPVIRPVLQLFLGLTTAGESLRDFLRSLWELLKLLVPAFAAVERSVRRLLAPFARLRDLLAELGPALRTASSRLGQFVLRVVRVLNPLRFFDTLLGRILVGLIVWRTFGILTEKVGEFTTAMIQGNAQLENAAVLFRRIAGPAGARALVNTLREISEFTGVAISELAQYTRRLPALVGSMDEFRRVVVLGIGLALQDPVQGLQGAFLAITEFLSGTITSLQRRFEISGTRIRQALEQTSSPVEALERVLAEVGIDVGLLTDLMTTFDGASMRVKSSILSLARELGKPIFELLRRSLVNMAEWLERNREKLVALAYVLGGILADALESARRTLSRVFGGATLDEAIEGLAGFMQRLARALNRFFINFIVPVFVNISGMIASLLSGQPFRFIRPPTTFGEFEPRPVAEAPPTAAPRVPMPAAGDIGESVGGLLTDIFIDLGPLDRIRDAGRKTLEQYVLGIVQGLESGEIRELAQKILDNVINAEAAEAQAQIIVDAFEEAVRIAQAEVDRIQSKLRVFDILTRDISPELTRGARMRMELELLAAQEELKSRQEGLRLAREQLAAAREFAQTQREILRLLEQQMKKSEEAPTPVGGIGQDFLDSTKQQANEYIAIIEGMFKGATAAWQQGFQNLSDFVAGLASGRPDVTIPRVGAPEEAFIEETPFNLGAQLRQNLDIIFGSIEGVFTRIQEAFGLVTTWWEGLDPELKDFLLKLAVGFGVAVALNFVTGGFLSSLAAIGIDIIEKNWVASLAVVAALVWSQSEAAEKIRESVTEFGEKEVEPLVADLWYSIWDALKDDSSKTTDAVHKGISKPVTDELRKLKKDVVGNSIIPQMLQDILILFAGFPARLLIPLNNLTTQLTDWAVNVSIVWNGIFIAMLNNFLAIMAIIEQKTGSDSGNFLLTSQSALAGGGVIFRNGQLPSATVTVNNIFNGPVYGLGDFEDQVTDITLRTFGRVLPVV